MSTSNIGFNPMGGLIHMLDPMNTGLGAIFPEKGPAAPALPAIPTAPSVATTGSAPQATAVGQNTTILTSGLGDTSQPTLGKKTLSGQ